MNGLNIWLDIDGTLNETAKRHFVSTVNDHCFIASVTGNVLEQALELTFSESAPRDKDLGRRHVFAAIEQIVLYGGRISALIAPIESTRKTYPELAALRRARSKFMAGVFPAVEFRVLHEREVRNRVEHYDERVEASVVKAGAGVGWVEDLLGPKSAIKNENSTLPIWQRRFDWETGEFEVLNETTNIRLLLADIRRAQELAESWLNGGLNGESPLTWR